MPLIVEDGTGLTAADSYVSLEDSNIFHEERSADMWAAASTAAREAALRNAADWLDANYRFIGQRLSTGQALQWPRLTTGGTAIPHRVKKAQMMAALEALAGPLMPRQEGAPVTSVRKKLDGVGEIETTYANEKQARYPQIDAMLADLVLSSAGGSIGFASVVRR